MTPSNRSDGLVPVLTRVMRLALALTGDQQAAEDITQTAVMRLLPRLADVRDQESYLRQTVINLVRDRHRRNKLIRFVPEIVAPDIPSPGSTSADADARLDLRNQLASLPGDLRSVLILRFYEDLPVNEVARLLGRPAGTVRRLTHEALQLMRKFTTSVTTGNDS